MRTFLSIMIVLGLVILLVGCRAGLETSRFETRTSIDEIGVELRRVDSLWSSLAEKFSYKIEFYPPTYFDSAFTNVPTTPTVPAASSVGNASQTGGITGGHGAVKSIEFSTERTEDRTALQQSDSVVQKKQQSEATLQKETSSEARQDNGTVFIVTLILAAALLIFLLIKFK